MPDVPPSVVKKRAARSVRKTGNLPKVSRVAKVKDGASTFPLGDDVHVHHGECIHFLKTLPDLAADVAILDPPYSAHVHGKARSGSKKGAVATDISSQADFGFASITPAQMVATAKQLARLTRRWVLIFSDIESPGDWRRALTDAGLEYIRTGVWVKVGATPQFTGDRPASGTECVTIAHRPGKKSWNGGGHHAVWTHGIETDRLHPTQKPVSLMLELVELFSRPGEIVLDPYAGSGTTGVAALRLGRRFLGCEQSEVHHKTATDRLVAEQRCLSLKAARSGQLSILDVVDPPAPVSTTYPVSSSPAKPPSSQGALDFGDVAPCATPAPRRKRASKNSAEVAS